MSDTEEAKIARWIETHLGGTVSHIERQARWRPAWFVDVDMPDGPRALYVRGRRAQAELLFFPLEHEAEVYRVIHRAGIPSPRIYGLCDDPHAIVMDRMPGRADLSTADSPEDAQSALGDYMEALARMHALPPALFRGAGLEEPQTAEAIAFTLFERFEEIQHANQHRPAPEVSFVKQWLRRNLPEGRSQAAFLTCDSGQFLFEGGRITAVIDLELAHIGDPALDLASLLLRDLSEPLGELAPAYARYEALSGAPIDWRAVRYYIALWGIMTPMVTAHLVKDPTPELNYMYNIEQAVMLTRIPLEAVAELIGAPLEPAPPPVERAPGAGSIAQEAALVGLFGALGDVAPEVAFQRYRRDNADDVAHYLALLIEHEPAVLAAERDEAATLLGEDIADEDARDEALERFALAAPPARDADLVRFFYRRAARREALLGSRFKLFKRREIQPIPAASIESRKVEQAPAALV